MPDTNLISDLSLELTQQSVLTALAGVQIQIIPSSSSVAAVVTNQTIYTPTTGKSVRYVKYHLHMDPAAASGTYNTVTIKVGTLTVFSDKFEPGLPWAESIRIKDSLLEINGLVTITTTDASRIFYNFRIEESP